jgi:hypothetical protein
MNRLSKFVLMLLGTSGVGAISLPLEANAASSSKDEERACEQALQAKTVQALEGFLRQYPHSTACRALALNALRDFAPKERGDGPKRRDNGYNR